MKMKNNRKLVSQLLCMMLIVAMACTTVGCGKESGGKTSSQQSGLEESMESGENKETQEAPVTEEIQETPAADESSEVPVAEESQEAQGTVLGEGQTHFMVTVVDKDGMETFFSVNTDKEILGEALLELGLIAGEEGAYGLYVKQVNGITADYDVDQTYWAFYINGEYAMTGVDSTNVEEGATYSFKVEK